MAFAEGHAGSSTTRKRHRPQEDRPILILTRKIGETLHIGDGIKVTVTAIKGNQVRIGIDAERDVPVVRDELMPQDKQVGVLPRLKAVSA